MENKIKNLTRYVYVLTVFSVFNGFVGMALMWGWL